MLRPVTSPLDDLVCFAMYSASHATTQAYREVLAPWDLTYTQYLALVVLGESDRTVSELGEELGLDSGTISPLLRRLGERGLVERTRDRTDERVVVASLTAEGRRVRTAAADGVACLVPSFVASSKDLAGLIASLRAVTTEMKKLTAARRAAV